MICNKIITEAHDARDSPLSVLRASLLVVKQQFRVVDRFDIIPKGGGHYRVMMIASEHEVDGDYTPGREEGSYDLDPDDPNYATKKEIIDDPFENVRANELDDELVDIATSSTCPLKPGLCTGNLLRI